MCLSTLLRLHANLKENKIRGSEQLKESRIKIAWQGKRGMREFGAGNCLCCLFLCIFLCPFAPSADCFAELGQAEGKEEETWQPTQLLWVRAGIARLEKVNTACFHRQIVTQQEQEVIVYNAVGEG